MIGDPLLSVCPVFEKVYMQNGLAIPHDASNGDQ